MVLDELTGDCSIPTRNWKSIISVYENTNNKFPIPAIVCSRIIEKIKSGEKPNMVFTEEGVNYKSFLNRYNNSKNVIEELLSLQSLNDEQWEIIRTCQNDPAFILGQDINRAKAHHFNRATQTLRDLSTNAQTWKTYMETIHPEEFKEQEDNKDVQVVIKLSKGLLEGI